MDVDPDRKSILAWAEGAPKAAGGEFVPAKEKFVVEAPIGSGGMGEVFLVTDQDLRRQVAMKILRADAKDREMRLQFIAEAQATSQLEHPGIPPVHDLGRTPDGRPYFTMKLVSGRTLREVLHDLLLKRKEVLREYTLHKLVSVLERICETLHFAHERGVIHRDLKPENVMLGDYGEVHVMDWGLARIEGPSSEREGSVETARGAAGLETEFGVLKGTLLYMSPEQTRAEPLDRRSDVYALGCLLYEVLTLQMAFEPSDRELIPKKSRGEVPDVAARNPRRPVPDALADVCRRAMQPEAKDRYATAGEMGRALRAWLDGRAERERRHEEAEGLAARGREAALAYERRKEEAQRAEELARAEALKFKPYQPVSEKRSLVEARRTAARSQVDAAVAFAEAMKHLDAALIAEESNASARAALSSLWLGRLEDAERRKDEVEAAYALTMIERYQGMPLPAEGMLSLWSDPPAAEVALFRYVEEDGILVAGEERPLGRTPIASARLPAGSYLLVLRKEGYRDTRYPVHVRRGGSWEGRVRLRTDREIGEGFVYVPAGPFLYGEGRDLAVREPPDFAIAKWPVTFAEYAEFLMSLPQEEAHDRLPHVEGDPAYLERGADGKYRPHPVLVEGGARAYCLKRYGEGFEWRIPVMAVSYEDADAYCRWKTRTTGREWRLPTEEEREKAARGVDGRRFPWGDLEDASLARCRESFAHEAQSGPIGEFPSAESVYGMGDAAGGVWDLTSSWFDERKASRVVRGGSWTGPTGYLRCAVRLPFLSRARGTNIGFRPARSF
ncbi:MAG: SUMF1/EgtB/PvdO family nonheme iron enzyme [Planctomycetes bacterium]|nr:SUMF1/EgtB/PvdO family nonheme iron enzyme [Planctomycetota bacterium]